MWKGSMNPSSPDPNRPLLEVRGARASSVIVQRIPPEAAEAFMEWQRGITEAAAQFPGYQATEIYPPAEPQLQEWVVVLHFDDSKTLQDWLDSSRRAEWAAKRPYVKSDYRVKMLPTGFGSWFAGMTEEGKRLPHWKMALTVLFGLYPTVMLLTIFLAPHTQRFGLAVAVLIGNAASVCFLEWLGMPLVNGLLGPWLRAGRQEGKEVNLVGTIAIVAAIGLMTFLFWLIAS
jgi:antibiotic biosynthesis monooxygenase (ABM) superfamily enzyme